MFVQDVLWYLGNVPTHTPNLGRAGKATPDVLQIKGEGGAMLVVDTTSDTHLRILPVFTISPVKPNLDSHRRAEGSLNEPSARNEIIFLTRRCGVGYTRDHRLPRPQLKVKISYSCLARVELESKTTDEPNTMYVCTRTVDKMRETPRVYRTGT